MAGLDDLASLLGMQPPEKKKDTKKRGFDGIVLRIRVRTEKRRGKLVTIAWGFGSSRGLEDLLAKCKRTLGAGGQVVDYTLEIQGDHKTRMIELLKAEGYAATL